MPEPEPRETQPVPTRRAVPRAVRMVRASIDAHRFGIAAMIPLAGLVLGPMAFYRYVQSRLLRGLRRNPGGRHALAGGILGVIGFQASVFWLVILLQGLAHRRNELLYLLAGMLILTLIVVFKLRRAPSLRP